MTNPDPYTVMWRPLAPTPLGGGIDLSYAAGGFGTGGGTCVASTSDWKPMLRWVPSQKGLFSDAPQRQRLMLVRPARSYGFPSASQSVKSPSRRKEPFVLTVILTKALPPQKLN